MVSINALRNIRAVCAQGFGIRRTLFACICILLVFRDVGVFWAVRETSSHSCQWRWAHFSSFSVTISSPCPTTSTPDGYRLQTCHLFRSYWPSPGDVWVIKLCLQTHKENVCVCDCVTGEQPSNVSVYGRDSLVKHPSRRYRLCKHQSKWLCSVVDSPATVRSLPGRLHKTPGKVSTWTVKMDGSLYTTVVHFLTTGSWIFFRENKFLFFQGKTKAKFWRGVCLGPSSSRPQYWGSNLS